VGGKKLWAMCPAPQRCSDRWPVLERRKRNVACADLGMREKKCDSRLGQHHHLKMWCICHPRGSKAVGMCGRGLNKESFRRIKETVSANRLTLTF
jgi:hypothetical protein